MKLLPIFAVSLILGAAPATGGMIPVQEADEAANCELTGAVLITTAPQSVVIFPEDAGSCRETDAEPRDKSKDDGAYTDAIGEAKIPCLTQRSQTYPCRQNSESVQRMNGSAGGLTPFQAQTKSIPFDVDLI